MVPKDIAAGRCAWQTANRVRRGRCPTTSEEIAVRWRQVAQPSALTESLPKIVSTEKRIQRERAWRERNTLLALNIGLDGGGRIHYGWRRS
jgi:hypothetical protein